MWKGRAADTPRGTAPETERTGSREVLGGCGVAGERLPLTNCTGITSKESLTPQARPEPATLPLTTDTGLFHPRHGAARQGCSRVITAARESYLFPLQPLPSTLTARLTLPVLLLDWRQPCPTPGMRATPANTPARVTHRRKMHPEMRHKYPLLTVVPALFSVAWLYVEIPVNEERGLC
jgi:hypothetical protein